MGPVKNYLFRCAVIGYQDVGKSSFIERYIKGSFKEKGHPVTTTVQYQYKEDIKIGNFNIKLEVMDTPGHDVMLTTSTLTSRVFVFLLFDVSEKKTFHELEDFIENFNNKNLNP